MNSDVLNWNVALTAGASVCGGKGWNLARLHHYGFAIPNGFVVVAEIYRQLLKQLPDGDKHALFLKSRLPESCRTAIKNALIQHGLLNQPVAVRSSATLEDGINASFAGIHESHLNVNGPSRQTDQLIQIEQALLRCYASLWSERAISYRRKMNIADDDIAAAIVISEMIDAQSSGVAFSCDPATGRTDLITVNANFGLGESVVSGATTPDEYTLHYHHQTVTSRQLGNKNKKTVPSQKGDGTKLIDTPNVANQLVLNDKQLAQLSRLVLRVFHTLGQSEQHQDIEWVFSGEQFFLTQARPVTALPIYTLPDLIGKEEVWTNGNFRDAIPMVLPLMAHEFSRYHINKIMRHAVDGTGYNLPDGVNFGKCFQGRFYCNASMMQWMWYDVAGVEPKLTNMSLGGHQACMDIDYTRHDSLLKKIQRVRRSIAFLRHINRHKKQAPELFSQANQFIDETMRQDFSALSDEQLLALCHEVDDRISTYDAPFITLSSASGAIFMLIQIMEKTLGDDAPNIANALLAGGADITSAEQGYKLYELAALLEQDTEAKTWFLSNHYQPKQWHSALPNHSEFKNAFTIFLEQYGHRAIYEIDFSRPRWNEDPSYLLNTIKNAIGKPVLAGIKARQKKNAKQAWQVVEKQFSWPIRRVIRVVVNRALEGAAVREMAKSVYVRFLIPVRALILEVGTRLVNRRLIETQNDVAYCDFSEIISIIQGEWDGKELAMIIEERKENQKTLEAQVAPDIIVNDVPRIVSSAPTTFDQNALKGVAVAAGYAEGVACVIQSPEQGTEMSEGEVLVAPSTDPGWTPLFLHASALVMETGGYLSHGSIVAREYGIPAVVNVPGIMQEIKNGDALSVDGNLGCVIKRGKS
ncbi:MAG: pyruvate, phosphate dikinase [Gammaproteobacteria bacterium]|nr:pyruvate, phosphate dikinase [Gammaproteobacteria bacterium]